MPLCLSVLSLEPSATFKTSFIYLLSNNSRQRAFRGRGECLFDEERTKGQAGWVHGREDCSRSRLDPVDQASSKDRERAGGRGVGLEYLSDLQGIHGRGPLFVNCTNVTYNA